MTSVAKFYSDVIDDVISGVKDEFTEEGGDVQVLEELKKLWKSKLADTHVCDPEPVQGTAAQYLNLLQRSQVQVHSNSNNNSSNLLVRQISPANRPTSVDQYVAPTQMGIPIAATTNNNAVRFQNTRLANLPIRPNQLIQPVQQQQQPQQQPTQPNILLPAQNKIQTANILPSTVGMVQQNRTIAAAIHQPGTAVPQLATLPSGLTGHLVQIGQQTYLVPQSIGPSAAIAAPPTANIVNRQPGIQLSMHPQFVTNSNLLSGAVVGAPSTNNFIINNNGTIGNATFANPITNANILADSKSFQLNAMSQFKQSQVDGGNDSDDGKYYATSNLSQHGVLSNPTGRRKYSSRTQSSTPMPGVTPNLHSDLEEYDDDDDDDDDDLVPATPGFVSPGSVRSAYHQHGSRNLMYTPNPNEPGGNVTPLISAPPTPLSPSRHSGKGHNLKRRRRSSDGVGAAGGVGSGGGGDDDELDAADDVNVSGSSSATDIKPNLDYRSHKTHKNTAKIYSTNDDADQPPSSNPLVDSVVPLSDLHADDHVDEDDEADEEEPLNSEDDVSDDEPEVLFESDNVVVCQYDKIHRARNKWRFQLKDGIMSINGRDLVFQKAIGEAEW